MKNHKTRRRLWQAVLFPIIDVSLNGVNYLFHVIAGRYLLPIDYGTLNALLGVIALLYVGGEALQIFAAKEEAAADSRGDKKRTYTVLLAGSFLVGIFILGLWFFVLPWLRTLTRATNWALWLVPATFLVNFALSLGRGVMLGQKRFLRLNASFVIETCIKTGLLFGLLPFFPFVEIPLIALFVGTAASLAHALWLLRPDLSRRRFALGQKKENPSMAGKVFFSLSALTISHFFIFYLTSIDMILFNYRFPDLAGDFAVLEKYGMLMLFVPLSLHSLYIPYLVPLKTDRRKFAVRLFLFFGLQTSVTLFILLAYYWPGPLTVVLLFGPSYGQAASGLWQVGVVYILLAANFFFVQSLGLLEKKAHLLPLLAVSLILSLVVLPSVTSIGDLLYKEALLYAGLLPVMILITLKEIFAMNQLAPDQRSTILFLSWRDIKSPKSGGAEVFTHHMLAAADQKKYRFIHFSPACPGLPGEEVIDGVTYKRAGGVLSVIGKARAFYRRHHQDIDYVVDQCNTHRFFSRFWVPGAKRIFFIHQLTKEIWNINTRFPINIIGRKSEVPLLRLSRRDYTLTVSPSTQKDLLANGFDPKKLFILPEGLAFSPWPKPEFKPKEDHPTFIYVGRYSSYKGIDKAVAAFALFKKARGTGCLWLAGKKDESYRQKVLLPLLDQNHLTLGVDVIEYGFVEQEQKLELMSRAHALLFPSQREGWGLTVTEAAAVGTPAIVFDSPGLVDAVDNGRAGFLCRQNSPAEMARLMALALDDKPFYDKINGAAYAFSRQFNWQNTAAAFNRAMAAIEAGAEADELAVGEPVISSPKSVVLLFTAYNNQDIVEGTIQSCLAQNYANYQVIMVDDGSEDQTFERAAALQENRPDLHCFTIPHGERGASRRRAFREAAGFSPDYIFFFDSDMRLRPNLVSDCVDYLEAHPDLAALVIPERAWSEAGNFVSKVKVFERNTINNAGRKIGLASIEAARFWRYDDYLATGGINFNQIAFEETQPTIRCLEQGGKIERALFTGVDHHEGRVTLKNLFGKKNYYFSVMGKTFDSEAGGFGKAVRRWYFFRPVLYRPANLARYIRHPLLALGMMTMYLALSASAFRAYLAGKAKARAKETETAAAVK